MTLLASLLPWCVPVQRWQRAALVRLLLGQRADHQGERDRGFGIERDEAGVGGDLAPGHRLFEGAAGKAAPLRLVHRDLDAVAVAGTLAAEEVTGDAALLDVVLGVPPPT